MSVAACVGLSDAPNLTDKRVNSVLSVYRYVNGETKITASKRARETKRPPVRSGKLESSNLTRRAASKIKQAARMLKSKHPVISFITLTYKQQDKDQKQAKRDINTLTKRFARQGVTRWLWVAEPQKRGTIHFHILTDAYIPKEKIKLMWQEITGENVETATRIEAVYNPAGYIGNYLKNEKHENKIQGNRYAISYELRKLCKPVECFRYEFEDSATASRTLNVCASMMKRNKPTKQVAKLKEHAAFALSTNMNVKTYSVLMLLVNYHKQKKASFSLVEYHKDTLPYYYKNEYNNGCLFITDEIPVKQQIEEMLNKIASVANTCNTKYDFLKLTHSAN